MKSLATPVRPWVSIAIMPARADLATRTSCARIPSSNSPHVYTSALLASATNLSIPFGNSPCAERGRFPMRRGWSIFEVLTLQRATSSRSTTKDAATHPAQYTPRSLIAISSCDSMRPLPFATASHSDSFDLDALSTKHPRISPREYSALLSISVTFIPVRHRDKSHSIAITGSGSVRKQKRRLSRRREKDADGSPHGPAQEDELDDTEPILQSGSSSCRRRCDRVLRRFSGVGLAAAYVSVQRCRG